MRAEEYELDSVAVDPELTIRELSNKVGITERAVQRILAEPAPGQRHQGAGALAEAAFASLRADAVPADPQSAQAPALHVADLEVPEEPKKMVQLWGDEDDDTDPRSDK